MEHSEAGLKEILELTNKSGQGSFLAVLKKLGKSDDLAVNSFPIEGYTLALDFKITAVLVPFLKRLDQIVLKYGGRINLSKDFFCSDYRLVAYSRTSTRYFDPVFESLQSRRISQLQYQDSF